MKSKHSLARNLLALALGICIVAGIWILYGYINWQGEKQWSDLLVDLKAKGQAVTWQELLPKPVAEADNFCAIPTLACLANYRRIPNSYEVIYDQPAAVAKIQEITLDKWWPREKLPGSRSNNSFCDLGAWAHSFRENKVFLKPPPANLSSAQLVVAGLGRFDNELTSLRQATSRKEAQFQIRCKDGIGVDFFLPHLLMVANLSDVLELRTKAFLHAGQSQEAWKDLEVMFKLRQACLNEMCPEGPSLRILNQSIQDIWEGMALDAWTEEDLQKIEATLRRCDLPAELKLYAQRKVFYQIVPVIDRDRVSAPREAVIYLQTFSRGSKPDLHSGPVSTAEWNKPLPGATWFPLAKYLPTGYFNIAKTNTVRIALQDLVPLFPDRDHVNADKIDEWENRLTPPGQYQFLSLSADRPLLNLTEHIYSFVFAQVGSDMAIIACELELFKKRTGKYPAFLADLDRKIPNDVLAGKPFGYQLTQNGRYKLWSVGWPQSNGSEISSYSKSGDWVWAYPDKTPSL